MSRSHEHPTVHPTQEQLMTSTDDTFYQLRLPDGSPLDVDGQALDAHADVSDSMLDQSEAATVMLTLVAEADEACIEGVRSFVYNWPVDGDPTEVSALDDNPFLLPGWRDALTLHRSVLDHSFQTHPSNADYVQAREADEPELDYLPEQALEAHFGACVESDLGSCQLPMECAALYAASIMEPTDVDRCLRAYRATYGHIGGPATASR